MDKEWQDIFYVKSRITPIPLIKNEELIWGVRCVHIITIAFGTSDIKIDYRDSDGNYESMHLQKLPFHILIIE